jgi:cell division cycle 14
MDHVEMYFDDGSNPSDQIVRDFIKLAEEFIEVKKQKVAVHCKAGLGRTGVLIGGK